MNDIVNLEGIIQNKLDNLSKTNFAKIKELETRYNSEQTVLDERICEEKVK